MHFFTVEQCVDHKVFEAFAASIYLLNALIHVVHSSLFLVEGWNRKFKKERNAFVCDIKETKNKVKCIVSIYFFWFRTIFILNKGFLYIFFRVFKSVTNK